VGLVGKGDLLEVSVATMTTVRALGPFDRDMVVQVSHAGASGIYVAMKQRQATTFRRSQVFGNPKRIPLGAKEILWVRNENANTVRVSFEAWPQVEGAAI
jgi:hypothetical protein